MDFAPDPVTEAVGDVAGEAFARLDADWTDRFTAHHFDVAAWDAVVAAGLTALPLPASAGGDAVPLTAAAVLAARAGRSAAVTPLLGTLAAAAVLNSAPARVVEHWAPSIACGAWCAAAVSAPGRALGDEPSLRLRKTPDGMRLDGRASGVLHADGATALMVGAVGGAVLVRPSAPGVRCVRTTSSSGWGEYTVAFDDVPVDPTDLLDDHWRPISDAYRALLLAYAGGVLAEALEMTARHVSERRQFGKPIAAFQAVRQQLADAYVVSRGLQLAATSASWRLSTGRDAAADLGAACYWLAAEGPSTLETLTHLHGGLGVDLSYPLHRYFSITKDLARLVGGADAQLDLLAAETAC
ncbi:MAG: acyl-CoA dehydrogenase family protein [Gordonia sp. (in: high G+C Gram-positive bacteria)]